MREERHTSARASAIIRELDFDVGMKNTDRPLTEEEEMVLDVVRALGTATEEEVIMELRRRHRIIRALLWPTLHGTN